MSKLNFLPFTPHILKKVNSARLTSSEAFIEIIRILKAKIRSKLKFVNSIFHFSTEILAFDVPQRVPIDKVFLYIFLDRHQSFCSPQQIYQIFILTTICPYLVLG
ncbi:hypothetical protein DF044_00200 [Burkholderia contaminans]|nr:hypothetical protein DF044_00200 [Burkholderia contaminans]